ncbi:HD domain-containing protein [candidate division TA06 bacterium]|uniref:5'-deoxynucleotidase n=1 Tax=candidate division TA06 bacterium TaxID=2250710 RepID=A0A933MKF8_UNCT6|nr:HD domain-containing protein [candidate division TA06 bacterium]
MNLELLLSFLGKLEKLKCMPRHSWTSSGRQESVAEHSWRLAAIIYLLKDELKGYDIEKMLAMALFHDLSEIKHGDIPGFDKTDADVKNEKKALADISKEYNQLGIGNIINTIDDFDGQFSKEAQLVKALDKLEAVIQHNEADIKTWIDREYGLNLSYGFEECQIENTIADFRKLVKEKTMEKIHNQNPRI